LAARAAAKGDAMRFSASRFLVVVSLGFLSAPAQASGPKPEFHIINDFSGGLDFVVPHGISADGRTVVGVSNSASGNEAFVWTNATGMERLPATPLGRPNMARDVSADGSVIVGEIVTPQGERPFRWTRGVGYELIVPELANINVSVLALSDDGRIVAGDASSSTSLPRAFIWSAESGVQFLGDLAGGVDYSEARNISADGKTIVGIGSSSIGEEAFRWTLEDGIHGLGSLEGEDSPYQSVARAVSADGSIVAGHSISTGFTSIQATIWNATSGLVGLGERQRGPYYWSEAHAVSADGSVIVGQHTEQGRDGAFIWDAERGFRSLTRELVEKHSLGEEIGDFQIASAMAVSADGRTITGFGGGSFSHAWVATVPEPSTLVLGTLATLLSVLVTRRKSGA
jgi:probable HAF family extracellular repeat protein